MAVIKMNLDEINEGFTPIPEGEYEAYVFEVKRKTFNSGNEGFSITYNIAEEPYKKRKIFDNLVITEAAFWKLGQFYKAVTGYSGEVEINTNEFPSFVGKRVRLSIAVEEQTYQGETKERNVVKNVSFIGGSVPIGVDLMDSLADREGAAISDASTPF
ncbi:hypothetical protein DCC39_10375 [Pueribacillus theae]|uniref:DUF669 domain-containing protein n=1 Tax=Pueribacillus theae TaxID=2171751 RepID=A0A2U1K1G9_9BACI|nr:DUF669 domain-containing protein [Pueribacillus theae]PWA11095.1 hypothetical protein DCC39_10375 [Pueribacillus theae]